MATQQDVIVAVEASGKVGLKAGLIDLMKDGGAIDMEVDALTEQLPPLVKGAVKGLAPFVKQILQGIVEKL